MKKKEEKKNIEKGLKLNNEAQQEPMTTMKAFFPTWDFFCCPSPDAFAKSKTW